MQQDNIKVSHDKETDGLAKAIIKKHGGKLKQKGGKRKKGIEKILEDIYSDSTSDGDDSKKPTATEGGLTLDKKRALNVRRNEKFLKSTRLLEGLSRRQKQTAKRVPKKKSKSVDEEDSDYDSSVSSCDNLSDNDDEGKEENMNNNAMEDEIVST